MQLQTLRSEVRIRAGLEDSDGYATDTILTSLVNAAVREVANMRDWDWSLASETINTIAGTGSYARAAGARTSVRIVDETSDIVLRQVTPDFFVRYADLSGPPKFWYVQAGQLKIAPVPNDVRALTHVYHASEAALVADTDVPTIPDYAIDLVIVKAALKLAARVDNTSQHRLLQAEERSIEEALQDDVRRQKGAPIINTRRDWV